MAENTMNGEDYIPQCMFGLCSLRPTTLPQSTATLSEFHSCDQSFAGQAVWHQRDPKLNEALFLARFRTSKALNSLDGSMLSC